MVQGLLCGVPGLIIDVWCGDIVLKDSVGFLCLVHMTCNSTQSMYFVWGVLMCLSPYG